MIKFIDQDAPEQMAPMMNPDKVSEMPLDRYLLNIDKLVKTEQESQESKIRAQTIIQMCRRFRGTTPSDLFGFWSNGVWADSPKFSALHGTNVFQALIQGAAAGYLQANLSLDVSAKSNNFQNRSVEKIARSIYEVLNRNQWTDGTEKDVFYASILKLNAFVISRFNKAGGPMIKSPAFDPISFEQGGQWVCPNCYTSGSGTAQECLACGSPISSLEDPSMMQDFTVPEFKDVPAGTVEIVVADGLDVTVDDRRGKSADITSCAWVQWRYLAAKAELKKLYPHLALKSKPEWSYNTRLKVALKKFKNGEASPESQFEKNNYEVKQTWLDLSEYEDYVSPSDITVGNCSLRANERLADKYPDGIVMGVVNNEVAFVDGENKNKRVKAAAWLTDPSSFYGLGARAGLPIQKKINQLDNMAMEGEARSMKGSIVYVPEAIDGAMLEGANTNIPLRPDFATGGQPLRNFMQPIEVSGLSGASLNFLSSQVETMQRVMGIPNVSLGEGDSNAQTASGQALIDRRATGLLVPAKKSEGQMKVGWLKDQLDLIQSFYSPEALLQFGARYGEEWLQDEVYAFFEANLDDAITIEIVEGSEVPETRFDKQQRLRNDVLAGLIPMTPALQSKLAQQSGYDGVDVNYFDSNHKLAQKRLAYVKEATSDPQVEAAYQQMESMMIDPSTGQRAMDLQGNLIPNPILLQLIHTPQMAINKQAENHEQHFQFWAERTREFLSSGQQQPQVLIAVCDAMMTRHKQAAFEESTKAQALAGIMAAPPAAGNALMAQALTPQQPQEKQE